METRPKLQKNRPDNAVAVSPVRQSVLQKNLMPKDI